MSATSDKLKEIIDAQIKKQKDNLEAKVDNALALYKSGDERAEKLVKDIEKGIEDAEQKKQQVEDTMNTIKSAKDGFDNARKAAEVTEKASSISSALNPAAAAIAYAQKFIIESLKDYSHKSTIFHLVILALFLL